MKCRVERKAVPPNAVACCAVVEMPAAVAQVGTASVPTNALGLDARLPSECLREFFGGYFCLPQDASKCADLDFRMHGNYTALAAASQNDVTSALTNPYKSESL